MKNGRNNFVRDLGIVVLSVFVAVMLAKTGALAEILTGTQEWKFFGSFLAGMFFVSIFTVAPAGVVLFEIAAANSIWEVALFGGIGGLLGDFLIFRFIQNDLVQDLRWLASQTRRQKIFSVFRLKFFRWLLPLVGALIVASPFPDEIGLAMMGFSKVKTAVFVPASFILNFLGILAIGLFAKGML